jgi:hypothetical protein
MSSPLKRSACCRVCGFVCRKYSRACARCDRVVCEKCTLLLPQPKLLRSRILAPCCGNLFCADCAACAWCDGERKRAHRCRAPGKTRCWICDRDGCLVCIDLVCKTPDCTGRLCDKCAVYCRCGCRTVRCRICMLECGVSRQCAVSGPATPNDNEPTRIGTGGV